MTRKGQLHELLVVHRSSSSQTQADFRCLHDPIV